MNSRVRRADVFACTSLAAFSLCGSGSYGHAHYCLTTPNMLPRRETCPSWPILAGVGCQLAMLWPTNPRMHYRRHSCCKWSKPSAACCSQRPSCAWQADIAGSWSTTLQLVPESLLAQLQIVPASPAPCPSCVCVLLARAFLQCACCPTWCSSAVLLPAVTRF